MNPILTAATKIETRDTGINGCEELANSVAACAADTVTLMIKTLTYHWNVVGPLFVSLHELTEHQYRDLFEATDLIAERVRALGYPAPVSLTEIVSLSEIQDCNSAQTAGDMIRNLVADHQAIAERFRNAVTMAEQYHDPVTADMLTARIGFHEKAVWILKALLTDS